MFHARSLAALESTRGLRDDALCLKPAQGYGSVFWIWANGLGPPSGCLNRHLAALDVQGRGVASGERIPRRFASRNDKGSFEVRVSRFKFRVSGFWFLVSGFWGRALGRSFFVSVCIMVRLLDFDLDIEGSVMDDKPTFGSRVLGELVAEFLGTFVLILFGIGVVAMVVLFPTNNAGELVHGGYTNITIGWGLGVTMGIYVAGRISGAHLNPAVTLTLAVFRGFPWRKVLPYSLAQTAGAFVAAALVYRNYLPAFHRIDPGLEKTAGRVHYFSGVLAIAAGRLSGPGDRHRVVVITRLCYYG